MTVTGRDIIEDLVSRMRSESEPLRYSSLAHGVYRVFLHRDDFERLAPARRSIVEEANRALDEELERLNVQRATAPQPLRRWLQTASRWIKPVEPPLRRPTAGWIVELFPDEDEELQPGHVRITSELMLPMPGSLLDGEPTRRVQPIGDATRRTGASPMAGTGRPVSPGGAWGELMYRDNLGREHRAPLDSDLIRVGRGGTDTDVDVMIQGPEDVSRVHLQIRRDSTGAVFLKDVSRFGTTLDNARVPPSLEANGTDTERWVSLPTRARIGLAGVVVLHYHAESE
jgi:FHA domain